MVRISSNATLFLKIFLPTFWMVFFGLFTGAIWLSDAPFFGEIPALQMKLGIGVFFLLGSSLLYFTFMQLKRIEADGLYLYVSNYFKTYRYLLHDIERISERDMTLLHLVNVHLRAPGRFGRRLSFLLDESMLRDYLEQYPEAASTMGAILKNARTGGQ